MTEEDIRAFEDGIEVDGEFTAMPALLSTDLDEEAFAGLFPSNIREILPLEVTEYSQTLVTIREGKYHQIKRMFASRGKEVLYLKRLSMGTLLLDPSLAPGQYRPLTQKEMDLLSGDNRPEGR